jgi:hypothetical protein
MGMEGKDPTKGINPEKEYQEGNETTNKLHKGYLAKTKNNPMYEVTYPNIGNYIKYMKCHSITRNFMSIWPF